MNGKYANFPNSLTWCVTITDAPEPDLKLIWYF